MPAIVSVVPCQGYDLECIRQAVTAALAPLGGMPAFVRPGMRVLLKPNLLTAAAPERAITTHPAVVQVVAHLVQAAGGEVLIGDSPDASSTALPGVWRKTGMAGAADAAGAALLAFEGVSWVQLAGRDYFIARPVTEADLVIDLPKLKTHALTLYTGAVKNLFGVIPGARKKDVHIRAPGLPDFSRELANLLELVRPGLTILDGVEGLEGEGPGASGTLHAYGVMAASADPVALDTVITRGMGFKPGEVLHLAQAGARGLGVSDLHRIQVAGGQGLPDFGRLDLPRSSWVMQRIPSWLSVPVRGLIKLTPRIDARACKGCGKCSAVCAGGALAPGKPPRLDPARCIGCMCCGEVCPQGAIHPQRPRLARLFGLGV